MRQDIRLDENRVRTAPLKESDMINIHSIAFAAVAATLLGGASAGYSMKHDEGVPHNLVTALKQDEGVPHNLVTALKQDEGVPHNLVTA
ncbi:MAG TPA: hypothetical protein VEY69_10100 [Lautropia sp.]|nr:hypothetical protein [Lautropia sp.]